MTIRASVTPVGLRPDMALTLDQFDLKADAEGFVGLKIAPVYEGTLQSDSYPVFKPSDKLRAAATLRNSDGTYNGSDLSVNSDSYKTEDHGHEVVVDDRNARRYEHFFQADLLAAEIGRDVVMRAHNERVIKLATSLSNQTDVTANSGLKWSNLGADIIGDVRRGQIAIRNRAGGVANVLAVDWETFGYMTDNAAIIDRIAGGQFHDALKSEITASIVAMALGLEEVIVAKSIVNLANDNQTAVYTPQWPKTAALLFTRRTDGTTAKAQFMRTFHWGEDGSVIGGGFEKYRSEAKRAWVMRSRMETQEKITFADSGQLLVNVL